jgi:hypothetical protein
MMECVDAAIARQQHGKKVSVATDMYATTEELLETMFSMWSVPRIYNEDKRGNYARNKQRSYKIMRLDMFAA